MKNEYTSQEPSENQPSEFMRRNKKTRKIMSVVYPIILAASIATGVGMRDRFADRELVENMTYQGYRNEASDGIQYLVFDDEPLYARNGPADLVVHGDPSDLEIGQEYDVEIETSRLLGIERVVGIDPSND